MKKVTKSFNIIELQTISHCASILRACNAIPVFPLANNINCCKVAADLGIKDYQSQFELIEERKNDNPEQAEKDINDLFKKSIEIEVPELKESEFMNLDISGDKEVPQPNGEVKKFSYRDAYFNLIGLVIN